LACRSGLWSSLLPAHRIFLSRVIYSWPMSRRWCPAFCIARSGDFRGDLYAPASDLTPLEVAYRNPVRRDRGRIGHLFLRGCQGRLFGLLVFLRRVCRGCHVSLRRCDSPPISGCAQGVTDAPRDGNQVHEEHEIHKKGMRSIKVVSYPTGCMSPLISAEPFHALSYISWTIHFRFQAD